MLQSLTPGLILGIIALYFIVLMGVSYWTGKDSDNSSFFLANRQSPWYLVAFGMIGASLSGVTFISIPGVVGGTGKNMDFSYLQVVFGYLVGYIVIATVLMPLYYRLQLTSIYGYLEKRFGFRSYKTGAAFFLLSRTIGAAFRLFLVASVLQVFVMDEWGIPFAVTVLVTILLIWTYTFRGGIKTIVYTDAIQTFCMLLAVILTIVAIGQSLDLGVGGLISEIRSSEYAQVFFFENGWSDPNNFFKQFLSGVFITIVMTGLDQDMMQKNLSCRSIGEAQKNMFSFSAVLVIANILFLSLGALLFIYASHVGIEIPDRTDYLYPTIALQHLKPWVGIVFILGLIAAAYSSADSALTSLTTSFCVDILGFEREENADPEVQKKTRFRVHIAFSVLLFFMIVIFDALNNDAVINSLFTAAGYTYGPLLGLYAFGLFMRKRKVVDEYAPYVCIAAPILTFILNRYSDVLLFGYKFGFELLLVNGLLTFLGLFIFSDYSIEDVEE